ncbi:MAG TPA: hypothetical protein VFC79_06535 [Tissierellaceae bacterium]|nr:hypothetical protein [Tissierellaceae bacterium]
MTTGEKQAYKRGYNNGFILCMASKGVVHKKEVSKDINFFGFKKAHITLEGFVVDEIEWGQAVPIT